MNLPGHRITSCLGKAALKTHALQTLTRPLLTRPRARSGWSASDLSALSVRRGKPTLGARKPHRFMVAVHAKKTNGHFAKACGPPNRVNI
jgi:hypothetical protein